MRNAIRELRLSAKRMTDICREDPVMLYAAAAVLLVLFVFGRMFSPASSSGNYTDKYTDYSTEAYAASETCDAAVYMIGIPDDPEDGSKGAKAVEVSRMIRGTPVILKHEAREVDGTVYIRVQETGDDIQPGALPFAGGIDVRRKYIRADNISLTADDVVREKEVYVRTPATIYSDVTGPSIASFADKGSCLEVTGYDRIDVNGAVNKYKVAYTNEDGGSSEGYVYSKYVTDTQEKADAVYNENGIYDKVKKDKYSFDLYGGKASHLDYYPYERVDIEGNEFCADARAMYLNCAAAVSPKKYIKLINDTDCNAVVVDIKDGVLAYKSETAKEFSPRSYKTAYASAEDYGKGIDALRETGVYLIGRIVVFNDPLYAKDHPEDCIKYKNSTYWPSAYSRNVWEYNVRLAQEAVEEFGFNEIQFDYVRFPEDSYNMSKSGKAKFRNKYDEEKGQAIQNFCFYAADQIHEAGAYFSVDVFGESAYGYVTAYGQYWPAISNIADAISAMPYTDHMGVDGAWKAPYRTMYSWAKRAKKRQDYLEQPAAARTWITGYDTPYWAPDTDYGKKQLDSQVKALKDAGLEGGFIPWNAINDLSEYKQYKSVWNED